MSYEDYESMEEDMDEQNGHDDEYKITTSHCWEVIDAFFKEKGKCIHTCICLLYKLYLIYFWNNNVCLFVV